jgi:PQQ-dependent catabolism-associated CXXCW motif protein
MIAWADEPVPTEPDAYRQENYRAPTPATLAGARVVTTDQAEAIWKNGNAVFVDVLPRPPRPPNLPAGTIWRDKPRLSIPGSHWLPDTGYGELAPIMQAYFKDGLARVTGGDLAKPLVIFCLRDCWMSWNAAKRALSLGYSNVVWYPTAPTDGARRASAGRCPADTAPERVTGSNIAHSIDCWIARASAPSRRSMMIGTSQT